MNKKAKLLTEIKSFLFMVVGCIFYGAGVSLFLAPNHIVAGGGTGLALAINILWDKLSIGLLFLIINVPIMIMGIKIQGWIFILKCFLTIFILGIFTDLFELVPLITDNGILASLYGGVCQGIGIGLFIRYQYSSGGTELLGRICSHYFNKINIPIFTGILDGIIVIFGTIITKNPTNMLYALIVVFTCTKISEVIYVGIDKSKMCFIITDKGEEISDKLIEQSPRGITMMEGKGMFTKNKKNVLFTCVKNNQLSTLKHIIKEIDESAFIIVNEAVEVRGKGFKAID